jgi:hypothetical protein
LTFFFSNAWLLNSSFYRSLIPHCYMHEEMFFVKEHALVDDEMIRSGNDFNDKNR